MRLGAGNLLAEGMINDDFKISKKKVEQNDTSINELGEHLATLDIPLHISFSENSLNNTDQFDSRNFIADYCFEKLGASSISF